ncbi:hypothetical protein MMC22_003668 [Lobaria immixta]|nr:hypothetical protein [Lobaria immixta]
MVSAKLTATFKVLPKELFRVSRGPKINLRLWTANGGRTFDVITTNGKVLPKALDPGTYSGTCLPDDLILVHERRDHYSPQPAREMNVQDLEGKIFEFFSINGRIMTKAEWTVIYPQPTEYY